MRADRNVRTGEHAVDSMLRDIDVPRTPLGRSMIFALRGFTCRSNSAAEQCRESGLTEAGARSRLHDLAAGPARAEMDGGRVAAAERLGTPSRTRNAA